MDNTTIFIHLFHILFVGALFIYIGINRDSIPKILFKLLIILGILILLYHSYKTYLRLSKHLNPWVNLFHIFIVAPLIIYIGINGDKTKRLYFELLLMLAFASIGYHGYYLVNGIFNK